MSSSQEGQTEPEIQFIAPVYNGSQTVVRPARFFPHASFIIGELVLAAALAALSVLVVRHPGPLPADVGIELDVQHLLLPQHFVSQVVEAISTFNFATPGVAILLVVAIGLLALRRWLDAGVALLMSAITDETRLVMSDWVHRPRPYGHSVKVLSVIRDSYSFPSGHVTHAVAVFGFLVFLTYQIRHRLHPAIRWPIRIFLLAVILLMPVSRVLEGQHWPTDVLGGALYGGFWLVLTIHLYRWAHDRWPVLLAVSERGAAGA